ncbi:roadblock/LC7 domain-containing protein [Methanobacterium alcaliphilum]|uniref:roadblock/LC7 domain-containing protein n=1 Tax=Methanobacterium alcaliphilum TaxID=392018 RepID=UPI00200B179C|nr:roadblock/LC7 domain-containing protein [Methanobacterium alcaliphilum]MCK9151219.1 roadblock/LC7 domain-containing protein [Methanobacterium alcaliphilum]
MGSELKIKLKKTLEKIESIRGVDGTLVVDNQGEILYSNLSSDDVLLFGSMANIISNSSEKLLDLSKKGSIERVLVESSNGKALFLNLEKAHLVLLLGKKTNIGMVILSSKKVAESIKEMEEIKKLPVYIEEVPEIEIETPVVEVGELESVLEDVKPDESVIHAEISEVKSETTNLELIPPENTEIIETPEALEITEEPDIDEKSKPLNIEEGISKDSVPFKVEETVFSDDELTDSEEKIMEPPETGIPVIKPPLSFPVLPENVVIPENLQERSELIIDIYEAIMLAMSIGASKIMGVSPARGMLKKSLPYDKCPEILNGVDVKSNSALQFEAVRTNLENFPVESRVDQTINDFTTIISAITDNYGRVMGYDAFRGMIRPEFKKIYKSFGPAMEKLGIKEKIHPELREILVS